AQRDSLGLRRRRSSEPQRSYSSIRRYTTAWLKPRIPSVTVAQPSVWSERSPFGTATRSTHLKPLLIAYDQTRAPPQGAAPRGISRGARDPVSAGRADARRDCTDHRRPSFDQPDEPWISERERHPRPTGSDVAASL